MALEGDTFAPQTPTAGPSSINDVAMQDVSGPDIIPPPIQSAEAQVAMHEPSEPIAFASTPSGQPRRIPPPTRDPLPETSRTLPRVHTLVQDSLTSAVNAFGLFRQYWHRPSYNPDSFLKVADLAAQPAVHADEGEDVEDDHVLYPPPWPFENITVYRLMSWLNNGKTMKSEEEVDAL